MKNRLFFLLASTVIGIAFIGPTSAYSNAKKPLLKQIKASGNVSPLYQYSTECTIYPNKIVLQKSTGGITSLSTIKHALKGNIRELITAASAGEITQEPGPTDGPTENDIAYNKKGEATLLKQTGSVMHTNNAPEADTLINFLNISCE
ncbi:hypothetical protein [Methylomicrobium lacus]|uniref:hypothetical protein n=1 Tax=Methylomicrobium lacus TaxID=136992 RepID=UPI0035A97447